MTNEMETANVKEAVWEHRIHLRKPGYISKLVRVPVVVIGPVNRGLSKRGRREGHRLLRVRIVATGKERTVNADRVKFYRKGIK